MSARFTLVTAALLGAIAVALGAFAAHGLKTVLSERLLEVFQTGVEYQFWHVGALLVTGLLQRKGNSRGLQISAVAFLTGVVCFSGSLYVLALSGIHWLGVITPLGGIAFIIGWLSLAVSIYQQEKQYADSGKW
ncbi:DUF423 domain-containing protein [Marinobacterium sediminicola]|uniref:Uncharacterized membrane protein YgdD, TMEM256/DUF423 family n=1 Tax=Marinobacterium sediminicola TaxID=518898 RepID=A0ABY1RZK1_9GAMM|nr:DUF423 domain-containing protein [Marinobacterium sediminicola]ULG69154.1 DUF423 domain-containing protein [Marinobacterium sediminicola]SMR73565.1 Uncharacterized membrane protein YgdD, TMEM256/DUF423 family [Marinobacterium sediminicola]